MPPRGNCISCICQLLLKHGANPNVCDNWNYTPLHEAAAKGKMDVCTVLLQNGADPQIRNTDSKSAVDIAEAATKVIRNRCSCSHPPELVSLYMILCI